MLPPLVRTLTAPLGFCVRGLARLALSSRLGNSGVVEVKLDHRVKHPLVVLGTLERVVAQQGVRAVLIRLDRLVWGWATLAEWREGLQRIREAGKVVVVAASSPGNRELLLAGVADKIVVPPMGEVGLVGVGGRMRFFGPALERLGLRFDVEAAGAYKSMGESFTRSHPSAANREAVECLVDDLHAELVEGLAAARGLSLERVQELIDSAPLAPDDALAAGLIDAVGYDDDVDALLKELIGVEPRLVPLNQLAPATRVIRRVDELYATADRVAVVHLAGNVTMGMEPGGGTRIAPTEVTPVLRELAEDDRVKAVVLSVNSPGGSVLASDLIWREVQRLNEVKPVVASFQDVAASGGYYIAACTRAIFARPGTVTGSIGVVGGKLVTGRAAAQLGVFSEAITRGRNVGMFQPDQPFDDHQRKQFRARLERAYENFVQRVSDGRQRPFDEMEAVARGRVWSGRSAVTRGLVDGLGGLTQAVERARELADLKPDRWERHDLLVRPMRNVLLELLPQAQARAAMQSWAAKLGLALPPMAELMLAHPHEPLAVLPGEIDLG
jgi:protease-4